MNQHHRAESLSLESQIDRLVDGELRDRDRRDLLRRLESEPDGWRVCALAFLESQCWRESLTPQAPADATPSTSHRLTSRRVPSRWRLAARTAGLAACLAMAFTLGWILRTSSPAPNDASIAQQGAPQPGTPEIAQHSEESMHAKSAAAPEAGAGQTNVLAPLVKQWEQQGFRAETQTRQASVQLHDGRRVDIPVHEVRLKYVRDRTY